MATQSHPSYDLFISFEWSRGLLPAHLLRASLAALPAPPRVWFALEQDAALPSAMTAGVAASSVFVFFATDGALLRPNVRHEVARALAEKKRMLILYDVDGPPLHEVLAQADAVNDPASDAAAGRAHLGAEAAALWKSAALASPRLGFYRDARLVRETAPQLLNMLELPAPKDARPLQHPFRVRALRPPAGHCDALIVAASDGQMQALTLRECARALCRNRELVCEVLQVGCSAEDAAQAVELTGAVVLLLTRLAWGEQGFCGAAGAALREKKKLALLHEADAGFSGVPSFDDFFMPKEAVGSRATPSELKQVYSAGGVAAVLQRNGALASVVLEGLLPRMGASRVEAGRCLPPQLPVGFNPAAIKMPLGDARTAVLQAAPPAVIVLEGLGGAGKSTVAASLALDESVRAAFDDVAWVTLGQAGQEGIVGAFEALLSELEPLGAEAPGTLDPLAALVKRLQLVCSQRAVLLVVDDVWAPTTKWSPDAAALFQAAVDVAPRSGGRPSVALLSTRGERGVGEGLRARGGREGSRGVCAVPMGELEEGPACEYVRCAAGLREGAALVAPLLARLGRLPLSLMLAAGCVRAEVDRGSSEAEAVGAVAALAGVAGELGEEGRLAVPGAWLQCAEFHAALELANPRAREAAYASAYRALQMALGAGIASRYWLKFSVLGLFEADTYVPEGVLRVAWGCSEAEARALLTQLQGAGLVKWEDRSSRAVLHDLPHDFASAIAAVGRGGREGAHGALVTMCAGLMGAEGEEGAWWRARALQQLRSAGRGGEATEIVWQLHWLIEGVRERGKVVVASEVALQLEWERQRGASVAEVSALKLLLLTLNLASTALEGVEGEWNVAPHVIGRLGGLQGGVGGARVARLVEEARAWDGGGKAWLRPFVPNFQPPGGGCEAVLTGPTDRISCVCLLMGLIVGGSLDSTLWVWDSGSGICLRVLEGHASAINCVCALADGRIVSGSNDKTLVVWNIVAGARVAVLEGHTSNVNSVCVLKGERIVSGSSDTTLRIWDSHSGVCLRVLEGHAATVNRVCALRDERIVSGSSDKTLRIWDVNSGTCPLVLEHTNDVAVLCVLCDGRIVSGSNNQCLRIWNSNGTLQSATKVPSGHTVLDLGNGRIAIDEQYRVCVWDILRDVRVKELRGHSHWIGGLCALEDGRVVSGSDDGTVRLWDIEAEACTWEQYGHAARVSRVLELEDNRIAVCGWCQMVRVWDTTSGTCLALMKGHTGPVWELHALTNGRIVSGSADATLRVWDTHSGACLRVLEGHNSWVRCVCVLEDKNTVVSGGADHTIRMWDSTSGDCLRILSGHTDYVLWLCTLPMRRFVSCGGHHELRLWDADTGASLGILEGHAKLWQHSLEWPMKGSACMQVGEFITYSDNGAYTVWDLASGAALKRFNGEPASAKRIAAAIKQADEATARQLHQGRTGSHLSLDGVLPLCLESSIRYYAAMAASSSGKSRVFVLTDFGAVHMLELTGFTQ